MSSGFPQKGLTHFGVIIMMRISRSATSGAGATKEASSQEKRTNGGAGRRRVGQLEGPEESGRRKPNGYSGFFASGPKFAVWTRQMHP